MKTETVWLGHNNWNGFILTEEEVAQTLAGVTSITITFGNVTITSDNTAGKPIRWAQSGYATGEVRLFLGNQSIPAGLYEAPIVVYDTENSDGIVWGKIPFEVIAEVEVSP